MAVSRILGVVSLVVVAIAMVSVVTNWSDDDQVLDAGGSGLQTSPMMSAVTGDAAVDSAPVAGAPTSAVTATTVRSGPPRTAELAFTGDIIPDAQVIKLARHYANGTSAFYDFAPMFRRVSDELAGVDLAICHLETTLETGAVPSGGPDYRAPAELAEAVASTGWDGCSLASEHAFGHGTDGVVATIDTMEAAGLGLAGIAVEGRRPAALYDAAGIAVAHLSYTWGLDGEQLPAGEPWWVAQAEVEQIVADARQARADGAELVAVSLHWGTEYQQAPDDRQREIAAALAADGSVDLVVGHHAHVVQPVERLGRMWVAYGLGNFISNQTPGCCGVESEDGVILHVTIGDTAEGVAVTGLGYTPTWVDRVQMQVMPVAARLTDAGLEGWYRAVLRNSWERTGDALAALGAGELGLAPTGTLP